MTTQFLERKFRALGARLELAEANATRFSIAVEEDAAGEYFRIVKAVEHDVENIVVVDVRPDARHLLLVVKLPHDKQQFLCGYDARHWFVAQVPDGAAVVSVAEAIEAVRNVRGRATQPRVGEERRGRKPRAFPRQGELYFIPAPTLRVSAAWIRHNEPLRRGVENTPHVAQYCVRLKGETVYVCDRYPNGLAESEYERALASTPEARSWSWEVRQRPSRVYVKGRVRHPDRKTVTLAGWHRVVMTAESDDRVVALVE
jgi:hypothetical protein